jgi:hypothetical protein
MCWGNTFTDRYFRAAVRPGATVTVDRTLATPDRRCIYDCKARHAT